MDHDTPAVGGLRRVWLVDLVQLPERTGDRLELKTETPHAHHVRACGYLIGKS